MTDGVSAIARARRARRLPAFDRGTVWIVGAGPGDPGLLTRLAEHALTGADVVFHDALVSTECLALCHPAARLVDVGRRCGTGADRQASIHARMIAAAEAGLRVVRLKGGDPYVFGRGGEEVLALAAAGIRFRVVPGITAGIGGGADAGIPVTHRGLARSVTLITGHGENGGVPDGIDWDALARIGGTVVFYMARRTLPLIAERLTAAGQDAATPVAVVANATRPGTGVRETTLGRCRSQRFTGEDAPAVMVVGWTVALRSYITSWQDRGTTTMDDGPTAGLSMGAEAPVPDLATG